MQNGSTAAPDKMLAQSCNGSEFSMMMEYVGLPSFMARCLGMELGMPGSMEVWDKLSKKYFARMRNVKGITWRSIHFVFGMSLDHCTFHKTFLASMLTPRVTRLEEFTRLYEAAQEELGIQPVADRARLQLACDKLLTAARGIVNAANATSDKAQQAAAKAGQSRVRRTVEKVLTRFDSVIEFIVAVKTRSRHFTGQSAGQLPIAQHVVDQLLAEYDAKNAAWGPEDTCWEEVFRRRMAFLDPRWRCFVLEQILPLGDTTPDLHMVAEMLVAIYKHAMRAWCVSQEPDCADLLLARKYDEQMHKRCQERNAGNSTGEGDDMESIFKAIGKMWVAAQIVAAPRGHEFSPALLPGSDAAIEGDREAEFREANFTVTGSGGAFPELKWS